jgi:hypothetical protein
MYLRKKYLVTFKKSLAFSLVSGLPSVRRYHLLKGIVKYPINLSVACLGDNEVALLHTKHIISRPVVLGLFVLTDQRRMSFIILFRLIMIAFIWNSPLERLGNVKRDAKKKVPYRSDKK